MRQINKSPAYLLQVGTTYHYRYAFPKKYCNFLSGEIRLSLRTGDLRKARSLAAQLANSTQEYIEKKIEGRDLMSITKKEIKAALGSYLRATLDLIEDDRLQGKGPYQTDIQGVDLHTFKISKVEPKSILRVESIALQDELSGKHDPNLLNGGQYMQESVDNFLKGSGLPEIPKDDPLFKFVHRELLKISQAINQIEQERSQGRYNTPTELSILAAYPNPDDQVYNRPPKNKEPRPISEVARQYISENTGDGNWAGGSITTFEDHLTVFAEIMDDCSLSSINYESIRTFFEKLKNFPANRNKKKAYRHKNTSALLKMDIPEKDRLKINTIRNYLRTINGFLNWAVGRDYMDKNYAALIKLRRDKAPHEEKDIFSDHELKTLFTDINNYKDSPTQSHRFWIPLIGLYTGARLEEISQFSVDDFRLKDEIWVLDISGKVKDRKIGDKKIKTNVSKRHVPVHKALIEAGLFDYHKQIKKTGEKRLFPDAKPYPKKKNGKVIEIKYGFYLGKWFGQHLKKLGIKSDDHNVSFHSFRHTFDTKAKYLYLPRDEINEIVGHVGNKGQESRYAKPYHVKRLKETIDRIGFSL